MGEAKECTICLEELNDSSCFGYIQGCNHYYHSHCITQWSNNSNSCPTCRKLYYNIDILSNDKLIKTISIKNKLLPNDAINEIPREFVIPANESLPRLDPSNDLSSRSGFCSICSSSDYRTSIANTLFTCQSCNAKFHQRCLGVLNLNDIDESESTWCCPFCDTTQEFIFTPSMSLRRSLTSNRRRANLSNRVTNLAFGSSDHHDVIGSSSSSSVRDSNGLILHGDLDDPFMFDDELNPEDHSESIFNSNHSNNILPPPSNSPIINGGVILRKELKQYQDLSPEEMKSWDLFDKAKNANSDLEFNSSNNNDQQSTRRRRKKPVTNSDENSCNLVPSESKSQEPSRISSLMSQIKQSSLSSNVPLARLRANPIETNYSASNSPQGTSPSNYRSPSNYSPATSIDEETEPERKIPKLELNSHDLTFEQKSKVQRHVRDKLRPLYRPKFNNLKVIKSEDDYININKSASRKIYAEILSLGQNSTKSFKEVIDEYFNSNDNKLKLIVDKLTQYEINDYTNSSVNEVIHIE